MAKHYFLGVLGLFLCSIAAAAEPSSGGTEVLAPLVVTAQKTPEDPVHVPKSVAVVGGEQVRDMAMRQLEDLTPYVPNLNLSQGAVFSRLFIRGIGSGLNQGFEQSVGIFHDGIYTGRGRQAQMPFLDVERVEVLRGPQGVLFGKNTTAGAINVVSARPGKQFESGLTGLYAPDHGEKFVEGFVSAPLPGGLAARVAGRISRLDGYLYNPLRNSTEPQTDQQAVRAIIDWDAVEGLEVTGKYEYGHYRLHGRSSQVTDTGRFGPVFRAGAPDFESDFDLRRSVDGDEPDFGPDRSDTRFHSAFLNLHAGLGEHTFESVSGFNSYHYDDLFDLDLSALSTIAQQTTQDFTQFSQEFRLRSPEAYAPSWAPWEPGALEYMLGAYYQYQALDIQTRGNLNLQPLAGLGLPVPGLGASRVSTTDQRSNLWALFGQMVWRPLQDWKVRAGLRYSLEHKRVERRLIVADLGTLRRNRALEPFFAAFNTVPHQFSPDRTESRLAPMFALQWEFSEQAQAYFSFSTGYKGGGFDDNLTSGRLADYEFVDEYAAGYEVGLKGYWFDRALSLNLALFRTDIDNLQVSQFDGVSAFVVGNAAKVTTQGVELDSRWQITDELGISLAVAYLDAVYDHFPDAACTALQAAVFSGGGRSGACTQDLSGRSTPFAPNWSGSVFVDYNYPLGRLISDAGFFEDLVVRTRLNVNFSDAYFLAADLDPRLRQSAWAKLNLRIAIGDRPGHWELAFLGRNLTNELTGSDGNDIPVLSGPLRRATDRPRTLAVQASVAF